MSGLSVRTDLLMNKTGKLQDINALIAAM